MAARANTALGAEQVYLWGYHRIRGSWERLQGPFDTVTAEQYKPYFEKTTLSQFYANTPHSGFSTDERPVYSSLVISRKAPKVKRNPSKSFGGNLHQQMLHAVTDYDMKEQAKAAKREAKKRGSGYYNMYALPQYLARVTEVEEDIAAGTPVRKAITAGFSGRLADAVLKAVGEGRSTREEGMGGIFYSPSKGNPDFYQRTMHSNTFHEIGEVTTSPVYGKVEVTDRKEINDPGGYKYVYDVQPLTRRERPRRSTRPSGPGPGKRYRGNPRGASEEMYESFHGLPSDETVEFQEEEHYHANVAALGELVEMRVKLVGGGTALIGFEDAGDTVDNPRSTRRPTHLLKKASASQIQVATDYLKKRFREHLEKFPRTGETINESQYVKVNLPYTLKNMMEGVGHWADLNERVQNPFWPFNSFTKTVIYHVGTGEKYTAKGTHKGYSVYQDNKSGNFLVPKLDAESRFDTKKDATKFIDEWAKHRVNPNRQYAIRQERARDWRVYSITPSGSWGEAVSLHETKAAASAAMRRLQSANPKHKRKGRHHGPFRDAGKVLGQVTGEVTRPFDDFSGAMGKVGTYLDDQLGRVINPGVDKNGFSDAHIAGQRWLWAKLKTAKGSFDSTNAPDGYLKKLGLESTRHMSAAYQSESVKERILRAQQIYKDFMEGVDYAWNKHYQDQHPSSENPRTSNPSDKDTGPVYLTSNEAGTQLYIVGGDQSLDLPALGITGAEADKEMVYIGHVVNICYHARKVFDGKEEEFDYVHKMGEDGGERPVLNYDRINQKLILSGGTYFINRPLIGTSPGIEN